MILIYDAGQFLDVDIDAADGGAGDEAEDDAKARNAALELSGVLLLLHLAAAVILDGV